MEVREEMVGRGVTGVKWGASCIFPYPYSYLPHSFLIRFNSPTGMLLATTSPVLHYSRFNTVVTSIFSHSIGHRYGMFNTLSVLVLPTTSRFHSCLHHQSQEGVDNLCSSQHRRFSRIIVNWCHLHHISADHPKTFETIEN